MSRRDEYQKFLKSSEWKDQRAESLDRTDGFCEYCGDIAINVHHVKYPKKFEENHPKNLVPVCKRCHDISHGVKKMEKITDAKHMTELTPSGIELRYLLTDGKVYASAKSWMRALKVPEELKNGLKQG